MTLDQIPATRDPGYARGDALVEPDWLSAHLTDSDLVVVEVDVSPAAYQIGHIAGAVLWNVYADLKDAEYAFVGPAAFEDLLGRSGISASSTVVFYGYAPALGLWLMKLFGHPDARILNSSRQGWQRGGGTLTATPPTVTASHYPLPATRERIRANLTEVTTAIADPEYTIVDVRSDAEFRGERFWPSGGMEPGGRAGHVPSARHVPIDDLLDEHGAYRNAAQLWQVLAPAVDAGSQRVITYCTIGGRAATAWFALSQLLGHQDVAVYDGSWAQWGRTPTTAVTAP